MHTSPCLCPRYQSKRIASVCVRTLWYQYFTRIHACVQNIKSHMHMHMHTYTSMQSTATSVSGANRPASVPITPVLQKLNAASAAALQAPSNYCTLRAPAVRHELLARSRLAAAKFLCASQKRGLTAVGCAATLVDHKSAPPVLMASISAREGPRRDGTVSKYWVASLTRRPAEGCFGLSAGMCVRAGVSL